MLGFWITVAVLLVYATWFVFLYRRRGRSHGQWQSSSTSASAGFTPINNDPPYLRPVEEIRVQPQHPPEDSRS